MIIRSLVVNERFRLRFYGSFWTSAVTGVAFGLLAGAATVVLHDRWLAAGLEALALFRFQQHFNIVALSIVAAASAFHFGWNAVRTRWRLGLPTMLVVASCAAFVAIVAVFVVLRLRWGNIPGISLETDHIALAIPLKILPAAAVVPVWLVVWAGARNLRWPQGRLVLTSAILVAAGINGAAAVARYRAAVQLETLPDIVFISIDTIRADHVGFNGYQRKTTPNLDAVATEGVRFANMLTPISHTLPSHAAMFTGLAPNFHGVRMNGVRLPDDIVTVTEILANKGYATGAFVGSVILDGDFELSRGFDRYGDEMNGRYSRPAEEVRTAAQRWLQEQGDRRFFLFLHFWDAHRPYEPPAPFDTLFDPDNVELSPAAGPTKRYKLRYLRKFRPGTRDDEIPAALREEISLYDGEIRYVDQQIGELIEGLKRSGLWPNTLFIVTGDHGESLGERGLDGHEMFYEEQIHVPFLMKPPHWNGGARTVRSTTVLTDITPTILDYVAEPPAQDVDGRSLLSYLAPASPALAQDRRTVFLERRDYPPSTRVDNWSYYGLGKEFGIRKDGWKLIYKVAEDDELYDLASDPNEMRNVIAQEPVMAASLERELLAWLDRRRTDGEGEAEDMSAKTQDQLKALGYIQ